MAWFSSNNKVDFISNNKLVEFLSFGNSNIEEELEKRYLYRNVESIEFGGGTQTSAPTVLVKYKDLKVRTEMEVKMMREQLRKEAGLDIGLGR